MSNYDIKQLWNVGDKAQWKNALELYWEMPSVKYNIDLEREMNQVCMLENLNKIRAMSGEQFYVFLSQKYYVWKYTAHNRLRTTTNKLKEQDKDDLLRIKNSLFAIYDVIPDDIELLLINVKRINGLGVAGSSGLLSILFPKLFGTVDQFLVDALCDVSDTMTKEIADYIRSITKEDIKIKEGVFLERILQEKAEELNKRFNTDEWTPRKIDMVLWTYRSKDNS